MTGRPVRLTLAALAILGLSASAASAGCYGCGYAPPCCAAAVVPSYEPPVAYRTIVYPQPMYIVNQGPAFNAPVVGHLNRVLDEGQYTRRVVRWHRHRHHHFAHGCAMGCGFH